MIAAWDEIRTAYHVARIGTVSGAAEALGVHHATVIRHVDALEERLGAKLFQRHSRGYTATEAGADLLQVAQATDDQFTQMVGRIRGQGAGVTGDLVVTCLPLLAPRLTPVLVRFQAEHPGLIVRLLTDERVFRLEYGEAHVAIRAGAPPEEPDNVVQPIGAEHFALYAARSYVDRRGAPDGEDDYAAHDFVGHDSQKTRAPFYRWMWDTIPPERIVFRATDGQVMRDAIAAGVGIGFVPRSVADTDPELVRIAPAREGWTAPMWIVTHVDLHRSTKVQAFLRALRAEIRGWTGYGAPSSGS